MHACAVQLVVLQLPAVMLAINGTMPFVPCVEVQTLPWNWLPNAAGGK